MGTNDHQFLVVMLSIAGLTVVTGVVVALVTFVRRAKAAAALSDEPRPPGSRWFDLLLAIALLMMLVILLVAAATSFSPDGVVGPATDWRSDPKESVFLNLMLTVIAVLLAWLLILGLVKIPWGGRSDAVLAPAVAGAVPAPPFVRLWGLIGLVIALLILSWTYLDNTTQHGLMVNIAYPATFALALVLLFDKATRAWSVKTAAEHAREWLHCDLMVVLLVLGFLNVRGLAMPQAYAGLFWDVLHLALFTLAFWLVDRKITRHRFLLSYAYFILLPLLLIIWRAVHGIETAPAMSWWSSSWPFLLLAIIFFIFEIIALIVTDKPDNQAGRITKDALFVALYGIALLVAIPATE